MRLEGELTGQCYRLGMKCHIRVARVDIDDRKIDFQLEKPNSPTLPSRKSRARAKQAASSKQTTDKPTKKSSKKSSSVKKKGKRTKKRRS